MRVTLRSITHLAQWSQPELVTRCGKWLSVPRRRKYTGTFWCPSEGTTIIVDYDDEPVDCMTCLVREARGGSHGQ